MTINDVRNNIIDKVANMTIDNSGNDLIDCVANIAINDVGDNLNQSNSGDLQVQFADDLAGKTHQNLLSSQMIGI